MMRCHSLKFGIISAIVSFAAGKFTPKYSWTSRLLLQTNNVLRINMAQKGSDEFWRNKWEEDQIQFHMSSVNSALVKYMDEMTGGKANCRIFVPLCGKSVDMKWLADLGHVVVGVEVAEMAIKDFFKENKLEFSVGPVEGLEDAEMYTSKNSNILLYKANLFKLNGDILGDFDCIWDRASLVALLREDIQRYADLMLSLLKPTGRYLLSTLEYDQSKMSGPPHSTPADVVEKLFADKMDIKLLDEVDAMTERWKSRGLTSFINRHQLLIPKNL
ncbi:thiopurine S-methyltransferase-like isoform X2 [Asterias rubens]|uniref:thiopurine S-methyltransferase-like isoform X2 n=1 Tax=Asterias rubens TaxID=7604 RepID=UPI001454F5E5|nr:thiopurine S-methyltransferase-like isoform X2 [Asterias rubens]